MQYLYIFFLGCEIFSSSRLILGVYIYYLLQSVSDSSADSRAEPSRPKGEPPCPVPSLEPALSNPFSLLAFGSRGQRPRDRSSPQRGRVDQRESPLELRESPGDSESIYYFIFFYIFNNSTTFISVIINFIKVLCKWRFSFFIS